MTVKDLATWRLGTETYRAEREAKAAVDVRRWLDHYEGHLGSGRCWLVNEDAEGPSVADLVIAGTVFVLYLTYLDAERREEYPHVLRFYKGLGKVPELTELYTVPLLEKRKEPGQG